MKTWGMAGLIVVAAVLAVSGVALGATVCTSTVSGSISGDVVVPPGQLCAIHSADITGSVFVKAGASLVVDASSGDVTIGGSVVGKGCDFVELDWAGPGTRIVVGGSFVADSCTSGSTFNGCRSNSGALFPPENVLIGKNFICTNNSGGADCVTDYCVIARNLDCSGNAGNCTVPSTMIGGNATITNNAGGATSVGNSAIGGNLTCNGNGGTTNAGNTVGGNVSCF